MYVIHLCIFLVFTMVCGDKLETNKSLLPSAESGLNGFNLF